MSAQPYPVLRVRGLRKEFDVGRFPKKRKLVAVDGIDFDVYRGETLAIVGESGSGKSTVARCVLRLVEPTSGTIEFDGQEIQEIDRVALARKYREMQMVFQDPNSSLNPRMTVRQVVAEPLRLHLKLPRPQVEARSRDLMALVGLGPEHLDRYPHQLSGGQRQRVGIARAIAVEPKLVILDEPTSSLDVSVRARIIELLADLQTKLDLGYVFISHDLSVVRKIAHRVAVMYLGGIVEQGATSTVFDKPMHPYSRALLSAAPVPQFGAKRERFHLVGEIPSPVDLADECRLVGRCPLAVDTCRHGRPPLVQVDEHHDVACRVVAPSSDGDSPHLLAMPAR